MYFWLLYRFPCTYSCATLVVSHLWVCHAAAVSDEVKNWEITTQLNDLFFCSSFLCVYLYRRSAVWGATVCLCLPNRLCSIAPTPTVHHINYSVCLFLMPHWLSWQGAPVTAETPSFLLLGLCLSWHEYLCIQGQNLCFPALKSLLIN